MFRKLATAAFAAVLALSTRGQQAQAQKALVYCPVGVDATGCDRIVAALQPKFSDGVDRGYDGSSSTVDLKTADLQHYAVVVVPSLADGGNKEPYALLRSVAPRLRFAINGRVAVYSGAPDQGSSNRSDKDALIQNLAQWAAKGHTRKASLVGLVAFLDLSENETERYSWVRAISLVDVSADAEVQSISDATPVSTRGDNLLSAGARALKFSNMASYGLHVGGRAAPRTEVGAVGGTSSRQSILVTYANADGPNESGSGSTTGQTGSTSGASFNMVAGSPSLSTSAITATATAPTLTTDKPDYLPGDTVTFTGAGFAAGDSVTITVHEDPTWSYPDRQFKSVADANGNFANRQMIVDTQDLGATFTATAQGTPSGTIAQATFTDGNLQGVTLSTSSATVTAGQTATYPLVVVIGGANTNCTVTLSVSTALPTGTSASFSPSSATTSSNFNSILSISTSTSTPAGSTSFTVLAHRGPDCQGNGDVTTLTPGTLIVNAATVSTSANVPAASATFGASSVSLSATIAPSTVNVGTVTFTLKQGATVIGSSTTSGTVSAGAASVSYALPAGTGAGTYSIEASYSGGTGFGASSATGTLTIGQATSTTTVTCPASVTYNGSAQTPCSAAVSGAGGLSQAVTPVTYTTNTEVGTAGASATYAGDANHSSSSGNANFTIAKATSTTTVSCTAGPFVYTGTAQTPCSVIVNGAGGLNLTPTPTYTDNVNAGTATASYSFAGDANHESSSDTKTFTIGKATSTTTVTCTAGPFIYTGGAQTPCSVTVTGVGGLNEAPTPTYANNIAAGTATASYSFTGDANHNNSSDSKTFAIAKASSTTVVTCPASVTYTGLAQTPCTVAVTGAGLSATPIASYTNNTNAGTATASYSFAGDDNHESSSDNKTFTIDVAASTTTVSCSAGPFTYTGAGQTPCTATVTGVGGLNAAVTPVTYTNNTNAGTAGASATYAGDANHSGSTGSTTFTIGKAASTTTVTCGAGPFVYTGSAQTPCSVSVTGAGTLSLTPAPAYTSNTNAGTASASYSFAGDDNHEASSDSKNFTIDKATSTTVITCPTSVTFDGTSQTPCSVAVSGASLNLTPSATYVNNTNAGTATASYTFTGDGNHTGSNDSKTFEIKKAASTTTVTCPASVIYDGSAQTPCTANVTGAGGLTAAVTPVTYTANTNAGTAGASASYAGDANHESSSDTETFDIGKAASTTTVTCTAGPFVYTGAAQTPCSVAVTGAGGLSLTPTANYANNTGAGTATASYLFAGDANHNGSTDSKTFTIAKAPSTTAITCPVSVTFNGSAQTPCSVAVSGASLNLTPPASYASNTNAGTATASYTFGGDANHLGSDDSKTFTIAKASSATVITCPASITFTGSPLAPCSVAVTGAGGLSEAPTPTYTNNTNAGTAAVSYSFAGDGNHEASADSKTFSISKAPSTTDVTCTGGPFTYTGSAQTPCAVAVSGAGGLNQTPPPTYANNVNAGTATASYTFDGDANHLGSSDSESFSIAKASSTVTLTCATGPFIYNGSAQTPCSASVSGVGGLSSILTVLYSNNIDAGTATATATYGGDPNHTGNSATQQFTIDKAPATVLLSNLVQPVNNVQSPTAIATPVGSSTSVSVNFTFTYIVNGSQTQTRPTQVGVYPLSVDIVSTANYTGHADGYFVIYDPTGGFVTGGGWIVADAGSCLQVNAPAGVCTGATGGRANFGFVSKYERGATTPSGNTEFQFQAGNLNFKSTSYQWLVVSGARAQYKGSGSINGQSGYDFILTAVDGALPGGNNQDRFRIKITRGDLVVFDNQNSALDSEALAGASTALAGGSISIKSK